MGRGRGATRGRPRGGRGRGKKPSRIVSSEEENSIETNKEEKPENQEVIANQMADAPQEAPTVLPTKDVEMVEQKEVEEPQSNKSELPYLLNSHVISTNFSQFLLQSIWKVIYQSWKRQHSPQSLEISRNPWRS